MKYRRIPIEEVNTRLDAFQYCEAPPPNSSTDSIVLIQQLIEIEAEIQQNLQELLNLIDSTSNL